MAFPPVNRTPRRSAAEHEPSSAASRSKYATRLRRLWDAGFAAGATTYRIELIQMMENAGLKFTEPNVNRRT
jgi:hypothetical protein